jgi:hypothetical protein
MHTSILYTLFLEMLYQINHAIFSSPNKELPKNRTSSSTTKRTKKRSEFFVLFVSLVVKERVKMRAT